MLFLCASNAVWLSLSFALSLSVRFPTVLAWPAGVRLPLPPAATVIYSPLPAESGAEASPGTREQISPRKGFVN